MALFNRGKDDKDMSKKSSDYVTVFVPLSYTKEFIPKYENSDTFKNVNTMLKTKTSATFLGSTNLEAIKKHISSHPDDSLFKEVIVEINIPAKYLTKQDEFSSYQPAYTGQKSNVSCENIISVIVDDKKIDNPFSIHGDKSSQPKPHGGL